MDDTMMTLPPSDRGRWNREVGEEIWRRKKAHDDIRKKDEMIKNTDCGIPNLPAIRRRVKYSDPELRFQNHPDVRRSVDIHWRYGFLPEIKASYRLELERQMAEKQQRRAEEWRRRLQQEVQVSSGVRSR
ncbi:unnamed protein product [Nezara viridula]|uniref:Uncharacterized protein n=1 Tax=Nezara viridula TaxID=85310 RepID=A0A9P0HJM3_NEZVI|nr:unnamed protein product [Nezara viridula]